MLKVCGELIGNVHISDVTINVTCLLVFYLNLAFQVFQNSTVLLFITWEYILSDNLFSNIV